MEGTNINGVDYTNHALKCRICFKLFSIDEHSIAISKVIARRFRDVTQTEVLLILFVFRASHNSSNLSIAAQDFRKLFAAHLRRLQLPIEGLLCLQEECDYFTERTLSNVQPIA